MSRKGEPPKSAIVFEVDPTECPFREFRDSELHSDFWGMGTAATRTAIVHSKTTQKASSDAAWVDDQTQPLPRSVRKYLHGWIRAEDLAADRWEAEVVIEESNDGGRMSPIEIQLSHAQVLLRSAFCRRVMSACFMLERLEAFTVEHQWENFVFNLQPDGWRARCHIYSPGMKPGGGPQHRPGLSKNGCYLVRLFYLGAWRCVWVSDQVPVDATDSPLLPFSPLIIHTPAQKPGLKQVVTTVTAPYVHLWPLLLCKALLKLAAPDMNSDEGTDCADDEPMLEFSILHALTGSLQMTYHGFDGEGLWDLITAEVPMFSWDDDDETLASTVKSKSNKKPINKDSSSYKRTMTSLQLEDTKNFQPYYLPGITPAHEMDLLITMARDVPLKKPLPEPEVAQWKVYRWVDWARQHGLYEAFDCPRTRFLKVNGLLKLSHAPHLLDVGSTESITFGFRELHERNTPDEVKNPGKGKEPSKTVNVPTAQMKEELREWIQYKELQSLVKGLTILYYPSMYEFTSAVSNPIMRNTRVPLSRALDIPAPKCQPLYLQIDGPDVNYLKISLNVLHPRILLNSGVPIVDYIEAGYVVLEKFEWFDDCELPKVKGFLKTRGYDSVELRFEPGRHFCRIWVHSRTNWHLTLLSESTLLLGPRDLIQCAAVRECPWAARFLTNLSSSFINWIRGPRSLTMASAIIQDKEFYKSYQPDLEWDPEVVGYDKHLLHWMFRQALQSLLIKKLQPVEFHAVCNVLRRVFCDPDFGFPPKPKPPKSLREIVHLDPCDCHMPETEEVEQLEFEEQSAEVVSPVDSTTMKMLFSPPEPPVTSQICDLATEDLPCGVLKDEREKVIRKHEAATLLQAHWRGTWARMCLNVNPVLSGDVLKIILENAFGNLESLSALMNEFFFIYPKAKYAYSVASALSGVYSLHQHSGVTHVTPKCVWVPFFHSTFYCHSQVKVHFDIVSSLQQNTVAVYDNDTGIQLPQVYQTHITFDVKPNLNGYSVLGHATLNRPYGAIADTHWQLTVLCSTDGAFHVCDNDLEVCKEIPLQFSTKLHIDEIFLPNRRNILGGVQISVNKHETVSFRAAATSPELELEAVLRTTSKNGVIEEVSRCSGKGELNWPYIRLIPYEQPIDYSMKKRSYSHSNLQNSSERPNALSSRSIKAVKLLKTPATKSRSLNKFKSSHSESKVYTIEVVAPEGWALTIDQWKRVDEVRNAVEKVDVAPKKPTKDKVTIRDKDKGGSPPPTLYHPQPDDAYIELECAYSTVHGATCKRDDERDVQLHAAIKSWDAKEPGRNLRGAQIRKIFRAEFVEALVPPPTESHHVIEEITDDFDGEEEIQEVTPTQQGPSPVTESGLMEMSVESEEEARYLTMPDQLKNKFIPLYFLPLCTKELNEEESVVVTPDMAEAARKDRHARIEAALERMRELQVFNELYVLRRQRLRAKLLDTLAVDSQWNPELAQVMYERDDAIAQEMLNRTMSANKKKADAKVKK